MPINIPDKIAPQSSLGSTHEDIYGTGGYVAIATGLSGSPNSTQISQAINQIITTPRRKVGMLVFDASLQKNFRCTATQSGTWVEVFANDGAIDLTGYVQRTELPSTGNPPVLDIASDTELAEFGLTALRVYANGTTNMTFTAAPVGNNTTDFWVLNVNPAVPSINQQASVTVTLNTNAINALAQ